MSQYDIEITYIQGEEWLMHYLDSLLMHTQGEEPTDQTTCSLVEQAFYPKSSHIADLHGYTHPEQYQKRLQTR